MWTNTWIIHLNIKIHEFVPNHQIIKKKSVNKVNFDINNIMNFPFYIIIYPSNKNVSKIDLHVHDCIFVSSYLDFNDAMKQKIITMSKTIVLAIAAIVPREDVIE